MSHEETKETILNIVLRMCAAVNEGLNEAAVTRNWVMLHGRVVRVRSFFILAWLRWKEVAEEREELKASVRFYVFTTFRSFSFSL